MTRRMQISPEHWSALGDTSPTTRDGWVTRLGGSGAAVIAVCGAVNRQHLQDVGDGVLAMQANTRETSTESSCPS